MCIFQCILLHQNVFPAFLLFCLLDSNLVDSRDLHFIAIEIASLVMRCHNRNWIFLAFLMMLRLGMDRYGCILSTLLCSLPHAPWHATSCISKPEYFHTGGKFQSNFKSSIPPHTAKNLTTSSFNKTWRMCKSESLWSTTEIPGRKLSDKTCTYGMHFWPHAMRYWSVLSFYCRNVQLFVSFAFKSVIPRNPNTDLFWSKRRFFLVSP